MTLALRRALAAFTFSILLVATATRVVPWLATMQVTLGPSLPYVVAALCIVVGTGTAVWVLRIRTRVLRGIVLTDRVAALDRQGLPLEAIAQRTALPQDIVRTVLTQASGIRRPIILGASDTRVSTTA